MSELLFLHPRRPHRVPAATPTYSGPLGPAWYARLNSYTTVGTGGGASEQMWCKVWIPPTYSNSTPNRYYIYVGGSGTRNGTGAADNDNTGQITETGNLPALITADNNFTTAIVIALQLPTTGSGSGQTVRRSHYGMLTAAVSLVASEWNLNLEQGLYWAFSQGALFGVESICSAPNRALFAGMCVSSAGGPFAVGVTMLDGTVVTNGDAEQAVAVALGQLPMWQYQSDADAAASPTQAKSLRDKILAIPNSHYSATGTSSVSGYVDASPRDHQGTGQYLMASATGPYTAANLLTR